MRKLLLQLLENMSYYENTVENKSDWTLQYFYHFDGFLPFFDGSNDESGFPFSAQSVKKVNKLYSKTVIVVKIVNLSNMHKKLTYLPQNIVWWIIE